MCVHYTTVPLLCQLLFSLYNLSVLNEREHSFVFSSPLKATHLDCLWDIADCSRVQPNQPSHFSHNGLCVFEPAKQAVKRSQNWMRILI